MVLLVAILQTLTIVSVPVATAAENASSERVRTTWYTYSRNNLPAGYYKETLSMRENGSEYEVEQEIWERQGAGLVNTYVNSRAKKNEALTPTGFYVKKRSIRSIDIMEGIANGSELGIRIHRGEDNHMPGVNLVKLDEKTIFGAFAPFYMANMRKTKGEGQEFRASTILEEGDAGKYQAKPFRAQPSGKSTRLAGENCHEFLIQFDGLPASWWITDEGKLCRIHVPSVGTRLELSNEKAAKQYL